MAALHKDGGIDAVNEACGEEVLAISCEPCGEEGRHLPAIGFCVDCQEHLCKMCFTYHRRARPFKNHILQDRDAMPRNKQTANAAESFELCPLHGEGVKYYCMSHTILGCGTCIVTEHRNCDSILIIEEELKNTECEIQTLQEHAAMTMRKTKENVTAIEANFSERSESIKHFMKAIEDIFAKLEYDMSEESNTIREEDRRHVKSISEKCDSVQEQLCSLASNLETVHQSKDKVKLCSVIQAVKSEIRSFGDTLNMLDRDNNIRQVTFKPNEQIDIMMDGISALGELCVQEDEDSKVDQSTANGSEEIKERTTSYVTDINIKSSTDSRLKSCRITGAVLMTSDQLVVTDSNNWKVKVVDTKKSDLMSELQLSSWPLDIAVVNETQVAVTVPRENQIHLLSVAIDSSHLAKVGEIDVNGKCNCIAYNEGAFIVSFMKPIKVEIIDLNGSVLKTLSTNSNGKSIFHRPMYLAVGLHSGYIYVSDHKNTVVCISSDGSVRTRYSTSGMRDTRGITVDKCDGALYVCGIQSNTIHIIETDGNKSQLLLGPDDGVSYPYVAAHSHIDHRLYVGMYNNRVRVYQLTYQ